MKKFLFLLMSLAVTTGAIAGVPKFAPNVQSAMKQTKKITKQVNAPAPVMQMHQGTQQFEMTKASGIKSEPQTYKAVVTEQPSGDVAYYSRSGKALWIAASGGLYYGDQSGTVEVVTSGTTVWFKNLLYDPDHLYPTDYWIKGTKNSAGTQITLSLPQDVSTYSPAYEEEGLTIQLRWGSTTVSSNSVTGTVNTRVNSRTFTIDSNGTMSLANASMTQPAVGNGLMSFFTYSSTNYFDYFIIYETELTYIGTSIPDAPTMYSDDDIDALAEQLGGELYQFNRYGDALVRASDSTGVYIALDEQTGSAYLYINGTDAYLRNPVYGWSNGYWMKGTYSGDKLTFPLGQYIYWDDSFYGLKTSWGTFEDGVGYTDDATATEVTYTWGDGVITMDNAGVTAYDAETGDFTVVGLSLLIDSAYLDPGWFGTLDFYTQFYDIPTVPTDLAVDPASTTADVTWVDTDDAAWKMRYREFLPGTENNMLWDFEEFATDENDETTTDLTGGWTCIDADGDGNGWYQLEGATFNVHEGKGHVTSASYYNGDALTPDNWLVSPAVSLQGTLSFWAAAQDPNWADEHFAVYVNVGGDPANTADFTMISEELVATGDMTQYTYDLSSYAGETGYVAIRHYNCTDMFRLNIDDIEILAATPAEWIYVNGIDATNYTIEDLEPNTNYEVQVQAYNNGGVSPWTASVLFTTLEDTGLRGDVDMNGTVTISDVTALINGLLTNNWDGMSYDNADTDLSGNVSISDVTTLINYLLSGNW